MRDKLVLTTAAFALLFPSLVEARPGERLRRWFAEQAQLDEGAAPAAPAGEVISYGGDPLQSIRYWRAENAQGKAPLIVFVHGGGWQRGSSDNATGRWKAVHYPGQGYAFASINYRLVPQATVEQQAQDVAQALRALLDRADALGIDRRRVVLMGHSAGAHLVALVGTDESYLRRAGLSFAGVAGIVPVDGAAYDVPAQMRDGPRIMQRVYGQAFGDDPVRQRALSPVLHAGAPNAPNFLLLHVQRPDGVRQNEALAAALAAARTQVRRESIPGHGLRGHMEINRRLGDPDYAATKVVDDWLRSLLRT